MHRKMVEGCIMAASTSSQRFSLCRPFRLTQAHTRAPAVPVDELDASRFECPPDHINSGATWLADPGLQLMDGHDANLCLSG